MPDFSTPAEHAFEESTAEFTVASLSNTSIPLYERYEIPSCISEILENGYTTVALQFPDGLLGESVLVYRALMKGLKDSGKGAGVQCYVLGDSTYGSCCPDVLSAMHLPADFLIHYGHACLTPTASLPVRYVFPKRSLDVPIIAQELYTTAFPSGTADVDETLGDGVLPEDREARGRKGVVVFWDVAYDWVEDQLVHEFTNSASKPKDLQHVIFARINKTHAAQTQLSALQTSQQPESLRSIAFPPGVAMRDCTIFYVGEEGRGLVNLMMEHAENRIYQYSPEDTCVHPLHAKTPRLLSRRLFALHSSFSASTYGILVHNVGLARSHGLVRHLRKLLKDKGKKSYTVSVGRVNPAKLANFEVVDCWVLVGCLEGGLVDSKEYYKPILTPWELQLSLQGDKGVWAPEQWTLDFRKVLADLEEEHGRIQEEAASKPRGQEEESEDDTPVYSLVTGELHQVRRFGHREEKKEIEGTKDALVVRNQEEGLVKRQGLESVAANHLAQRQWTGLDQSEGIRGDKWEPSPLEEGRRGIAKGYRVDGIGREG
ncbi:Diphthamide biosynthesis protein 2 [Naganishia albida]|nr:Diphthamide biosynthesis protein 2 [Naganishia albida]